MYLNWPDTTNMSFVYAGSYTSLVIDAGSLTNWKNISWTGNAIGELPDYQQVESRYGSGNVNMTGNVLLLHLNNDSDYGENNSRFYDFSGTGNNGSCTGNSCPIVANSSAFDVKNLKLANYDGNPLEDGSLAAYNVVPVDLTQLTMTALKDLTLSIKEKEKCKNFFALGLMYWIYNRPLELSLKSITIP